MRWLLMFAVVVFGAAGVYALWGGVTVLLLKGVATCAILALSVLALYAVSRRA